MQFSTPLALLLLGFIPLVIYLGRPRRFSGGHNKGWIQDWLALLVRAAILVALILALAGFEIRRENDRLAVLFLLDVSDSVPQRAWETALAAIESSLTDMGPDDQAGLILFGGDALVERALSPAIHFNPIQSTPQLDETDIAGAIRLAQAFLPNDYAKRIVLFSDGVETLNHAVEAAYQAQLGAIDLVVNAYEIESPTETLLTDLAIPSRMVQGDQFNLTFEVNATQNTPAAVRVFGNGKLIVAQELQIARGEKTYTLPMEATERGFIRYSVQISPQIDGLVQNNELSAYSMVSGPPTVLLVVPRPGDPHPLLENPRPDEGLALEQSLASQGFQVIRHPPTTLPNELTEISGFDLVILVDVPADHLTDRQMETLQGYVRDLGGGLIAVGGPTSFGVGGYYRTPLEEILPVDMRLTEDSRKASVTIAFVIDQSGSMADLSGGASKVDLAKEATVRAIQLMFPEDRTGVVSFDDVARWVVPFTAISDSTRVMQEVGKIRPAGGTDILAGLQAVAAELPGEPSIVKHIVLLTDGGADPTGIAELVTQLKADHNITLSAVGVGQDAAPYLLELANLGGGRYHFAASPGSIPSIFTLETSLVSRAYLVEQDFFPESGAPSPIMGGIQEVPQLHGYVATSPKDTARVVLTAVDNDPLLATWQYGLGTTAAFTSDAMGRWGRDWVSWDGFHTFWGQMANFVLRAPSPPLFEPQIARVEGRTRLTLSGVDDAGNPLNNFQIQALVTDPELNRLEVALEQVAPGRYEGSFPSQRPGAYLIQVAAQSPDRQGQIHEDTIGWVRPYAAEYRITTEQPSILEALVRDAGARWNPGPPWNPFTHDLPRSKTVVPIWTWLLLAACLLLPFDIALRRLTLPEIHLRKAIGGLLIRRQKIPAENQIDPTRASQLEALHQAKARIHNQIDDSFGDPARPLPPTAREADQAPPGQKTTSGMENEPATQTDSGETRAGEEDLQDDPCGANLASELLARKRARGKKR